MAETFRASASFTRPADTTAYASDDLVANSTTAASVTLMTFAFPSAGRPLSLRRIKITKSDPDTTNAQFRLWLTTDGAVTFSNGDNGALSIASSTLPIGAVLLTHDLTIAASLTGAGDVHTVAFDPGVHIIPATIYGFLEARAGYTPGSEEVFTVELAAEAA